MAESRTKNIRRCKRLISHNLPKPPLFCNTFLSSTLRGTRSSIMAEKAFTASDALKQLDQQLTCPVCLERYTQPRTLPCLHSFCHQCLGHFPVVVEGGNHCITCPVCRQTSQQPDKGVCGYQPAFIINNLLELH